MQHAPRNLRPHTAPPTGLPACPPARPLACPPAGEQLLRASGVPYTIVRPDYITAKPAAPTRLDVQQGDQVPQKFYKTSVADLAVVCVAALTDPDARNVTFELASEPVPAGAAAVPLEEQVRGIFAGLQPDSGGGG